MMTGDLEMSRSFRVEQSVVQSVAALGTVSIGLGGLEQISTHGYY